MVVAPVLEQVAVTMNWHETMYPSVAFPAHPEWNRPRVGSTHYYAAHVLVNGETVVHEGRLTKVDERNVAEQANKVAFALVAAQR